MTDQQRRDAIDKAKDVAQNLTAGLKPDGTPEAPPSP